MDAILESTGQALRVGDYCLGAIGPHMLTLYVVCGMGAKLDTNFDYLELKTVGVRRSNKKATFIVHNRTCRRYKALHGLVKVNCPIVQTTYVSHISENYPELEMGYLDKFEKIRQQAIAEDLV